MIDYCLTLMRRGNQSPYAPVRARRRLFTLVELLVVISQS